jgi:hypothetical protein
VTTVLAESAEILSKNGFAVRRGDDEVIAENVYALVMVVEVPTESRTELIDDAQARLTQLAASRPSARRWDLYLVLAVDPNRYDEIREAYEADTRYARKLIITGGPDRLEKLLRPLLPLRPTPEIALADPLAEVKRHLLASDVPEDLADAAVRSFREEGEVRVP